MPVDLEPFRDQYPWDSRWFERHGLRMHYLDEGRGEPLVMVHGNPSWSFFWRKLVAGLSDSYRTVAPDHVGMGLSDKPGDESYRYTLGSRVDDLEALLEAENLAMRPGPRPKNRTFVLEELRTAIKGCQVVTIKYRTRSTGKVSQRKVYPYGFLYGHRHYLVAYNLRKGEEGFRLFSLPNIHKVEITTEYIERDEGFDLEQFARMSFGVFHDEPVDVVWKFSPRAAPDAKDFIFHPDQKMEPQSDGSLLVKFKAGGQLEMCWHLFAWGADVEVIKPQTLSNMYGSNRPRWPGLP